MSPAPVMDLSPRRESKSQLRKAEADESRDGGGADGDDFTFLANVSHC